MSAAARAKVASEGEDPTGYFPGPGDFPSDSQRAPAPPGFDDFDAFDDFDSVASRYDAPSAFDAIDDLGQEPTPALLAARAEPLGAAPKARRSPQRRSGKGSDAAARVAKARAQNRRKPREPSKLLLALGMVVVIVAGVAAAWFFNQSGGDGDDTAATGEDAAVTEDGTEQADEAVTGEDQAMEDEVAAPETALPPVVIFDEAAVGPIDAGTAYQIAVGDGPGGAQYQLFVDGAATAEPAPELAPVSFEPGRHLLVIEITSPEGSTATDPVVVYAVGEIPGPGYRANLSSVNVETEGWAEAVRQFDDFVAAGHTDLQLMPSDWFPSLVPGYWNIFVGGFETSTAATEYCESFGLEVPVQCFAQRFDPDAPASE